MSLSKIPSFISPNVTHLVLANNTLQEVDAVSLAKYNLKVLHLEGNKLTNLFPGVFRTQNNLERLFLMKNNLRIIRNCSFDGLFNLLWLFLNHNQLQTLETSAFHDLHSLEWLNLEGINIENIDVSVFSNLKQLQSVYFKKYFYCTYAPLVKRCRPLSDGISSVNELLANPILRYGMWITCLFTCIGNAMVLCARVMFKDENKLLNLVIRNLAVSDFLMGSYMIIIAFHDLKFRNIYNTVAQAWTSSWLCTVAGTLATISSEVSMFLLIFMSIERLLIIAVPFAKSSSINLTKTVAILTSIWFLGIGIAIFPILQFYSSTRFYGINGLCFPLYIEEPFLIGWKYSAFIILGVNLIGLVIIAVVYGVMFVSISRTRDATTLSIKDYEFAVRFFFIVLTNACCWFPIIIVKILAYFETYISSDLYAWLVVFVLPINSAINPILYTFTTPKYRSKLQKVSTILQWVLENKRSSLNSSNQHPEAPSSAGVIINTSSL
ncbi:hypothetical protein FQR65_LT13283 [Abscondita terminalis]|nr:hypothetical protein FQR65_LT13283 [Abscondita terminalis]